MEVVFYLFLLCGLGYGAPLSGDDSSPYPVVRTLYGDVMGRRMVHDGKDLINIMTWNEVLDVLVLSKRSPPVLYPMNYISSK